MQLYGGHPRYKYCRSLKKPAEHPDYDGTEEFNYYLSVLFPDEELLIMDYNRVVKDLNGLSEAEFLAKVLEKFETRKLTQQAKPEEKAAGIF